MTNFPCWLDAMVQDHETQRTLMDFYTNLLGWSWTTGDEATGYYSFASHNGHIVCGLGSMDGNSGRWTVYFSTSNIDNSVATALSSGGALLFGPYPIGNRGLTAIMADPTGAVHGLWQPETFSGFEVMYQPGSLGWIDLETSDASAACAYYEAVLGCTSSAPSENMLILQRGDSWFASVTEVNVPKSAWQPVFMNTHGSLSEIRDIATSLGALIITEEQPVPGSSITVLQDPVVGQRITIMQSGNNN